MFSAMKPVFFPLLLVLAGALTGCGFTVTPPLSPEDPVTVFVAHEGIHTSLLIPRDNGTVAQFSFSRWDWAALDEDEFYRAPFAVLTPGTGTLGTRDLPGPATYESLVARDELVKTHPPLDALYPIEVSAVDCRRTLDMLDARWHSAQATATFNKKRNLCYVQDAANYSLAHTCNNETASWLRELGCKVTGPATTSDITIRSPCTPEQPSRMVSHDTKPLHASEQPRVID